MTIHSIKHNEKIEALFSFHKLKVRRFDIQVAIQLGRHKIHFQDEISPQNKIQELMYMKEVVQG